MQEVEKRAQKILASVLEGVTLEAGPRRDGGPDFVARTSDGRAVDIDVKWAGEGWPQDVRRVVSAAGEEWPENTVLLARHLSPGAIEWMRERGVDWADEAGQARILGSGLIVIREPARLSGGRADEHSFTWSKSAIAIAELILAREDHPLRVADLAEEGEWSTAQAAKVLKAFDAQGWTDKQGPARGPSAQRRLVDADGLLAAWSDAIGHSSRETRIAHRASADPMELLRRDLAPAFGRTVDWAISGWAGLELAAPFASTTPTLHVYVADTEFATPLSRTIEEANLREVGEGGRITFWAADPRVFRSSRRIEGLPVVSAPRLFADLSSFAGRGGDAADHVKTELIDPLHPGDARDGAHG